MELSRLPYELLGKIFNACASLQDTLPETLLHVCSSWNAVAIREPALWTKFVVSYGMITRPPHFDWSTSNNDSEELTCDWVDFCKRRLARAGPSLPLQVSILAVDQLLLPVIDVISGAPDYVHLPRWETLHFQTRGVIRVTDIWLSTLPSIGKLISQPMPSLKHLTLRQNKIDSHAFGNSPNLEELNILHSRSPLIGKDHSFPKLRKLHITYSGRCPLSLVDLTTFSLKTIETLVIGGRAEFGGIAGGRAEGTYPSLSKLELTDRVSYGIRTMSAPCLRHLILRGADLFCQNPVYGLISEEEQVNPHKENRELLEMLANTFPTVEVLEVHENLQNHVLEMVLGEAAFFPCLKELWTGLMEDRKRIDLVRR
jgi:hypothetical protein